jgi:hypothetical protein
LAGLENTAFAEFKQGVMHRILFAVLSVLTSAASAQQTVALAGETQPQIARPVVVQASEQFEVRSQRTGRTYEVAVALPDGYSEEGKRFPVLYVLEGNTMFGLATDVVRLLSLGAPDRRMVVVGSSRRPTFRLRIASTALPPSMVVNDPVSEALFRKR